VSASQIDQGIFSGGERSPRASGLLVGAMNAFLYQPMPKGFERAIETALDFNDTFGPNSVEYGNIKRVHIANNICF